MLRPRCAISSATTAKSRAASSKSWCCSPHENKVLTRADVLTLCADNAALVLDDIADAIGTGHAEALDDALTRALALAVNPQQLLVSVPQHFAQLRRWRSAVDAGRSSRRRARRRAAEAAFLAALGARAAAAAVVGSARSAAAGRPAAAGDRPTAARTMARAETLTRRTLLALAQMRRAPLKLRSRL